MNYELRMKNRGFTLIETLFAILIFSSALAALLVVSGGGISNASFAKNQMTASFLAQEGIEMVRNIRDTEIIKGTLWSNIFLTGGALEKCPNGCIINPLTLVASASSPTNVELLYDSNGFYVHNDGSHTGSATIFSRLVVIYDFQNSDNAIEFSSKVGWQQGTVSHSVTYVENLFNWQ